MPFRLRLMFVVASVFHLLLLCEVPIAWCAAAESPTTETPPLNTTATPSILTTTISPSTDAPPSSTSANTLPSATTTAAPVVTTTTTTTTTTASPPLPTYEMLNGAEFAVLVVAMFACYYCALIITSMAAGESTTALLMPFRLLRTLALSAWDCLCFTLGGRKPIGYSGLDFNEDDDEADFNIPHNAPAPAAAAAVASSGSAGTAVGRSS